MVKRFSILLILMIWYSASAQQRPDDWAIRLSWSPSGDQIAVAYFRGVVEIRDVLTNTVEQTLVVPTDQSHILGLDWSPEGNWLATSSNDNRVYVWDTTTWTLFRTFQLTDSGSAHRVQWHPDNNRLAALAQFNGGVYVWDIEGNTNLLSRTYGGGYEVNDLEWYGGDHLAVSFANSLSIIDLNGDLVSQVGFTQDYVTSVATNDTRDLIATGTAIGVVQIWDVTNRELVSEYLDHEQNSELFALDWHPDLIHLASADMAGNIHIRNTNTGELIDAYHVSGSVINIEWNPDGTQLAYTLIPDDGDVESSLQVISVLLDGQATEARRVRQIAISGDRQVLAAVYDELGSSVIDIFDANTLELLETLDFGSSIPSIIALSPNGEQVLWYGGNENFIGTAIYDRETQNIEPVQGPYLTEDIIWNPVNGIIAYAIGAGISILDSDANQVDHVFVVPHPIPGVSGISWSPDGRYLASSHFNIAYDGERFVSIAIWDTYFDEDATYFQETPVFIDSTVGGGSISFNPDGNRIALLDIQEEENHQLVIYDLSTNTIEHAIPYAENFPVFEWSSDGMFLAVGDDLLQVFDTATWEIAQTIVTEWPIVSLHWSADGTRIFHNGAEDGIGVVEVDVEE